MEGPHSKAPARLKRAKSGMVFRQSAEKWNTDTHKNITNAMSGTQIQKMIDKAAIVKYKAIKRIAVEKEVINLNDLASAKSKAPCGNPKIVTPRANKIIKVPELIFRLVSVARIAKLQTLI